MNEISTYLQRELSDEQAHKLARLMFSSFTDSKRTFEGRVQEILDSRTSDNPESYDCVRYVIWENDEAIAHAKTFFREMIVGTQRIKVLALASVCTDENLRGRGLGRIIVEKAFERVNNGEVDFCIFQTDVPKFYDKLGCDLIPEKIVNRKNEADPESNPFEAALAMVYSNGQVWPEGVVDLNGDSY